jgi:cold shock CspA family protein
MAEELGHQDFEAPKLCPKCRPGEREPAAAREAPVAVEVEDVVAEAAGHAAEPAPAAERERRSFVEARPKPEPVPEPDFEPEPVSKPDLDGLDELLMEDIGIKIKLIGHVKWFSRKKGFGFVTKADGEELFFHRSDVLDRDLRQLKDGVQVEFDVRQTEKGLEAFDVSVLPAS